MTATEHNERYRNRNPWVRHLFAARQRCNYPAHDAWTWYGAKGIKCLLTVAQVRELWARDRAEDMDSPSLDRIESEKDYTFENCRFIELDQNRSAGGRRWKSKHKQRRVLEALLQVREGEDHPRTRDGYPAQ